MATKAKIILFKGSGIYYTEEEWEVPLGAIHPADMLWSEDYHRIGTGAVLVVSQEPWGFPHLFPFAVSYDDQHRDTKPNWLEE